MKNTVKGENCEAVITKQITMINLLCSFFKFEAGKMFDEIDGGQLNIILFVCGS